MTRAQRLAKALMTHHRGYEDEGPSIFSEAADELKRIAKERDRLKNDLADALDCKNGTGPTALAMVLIERDRLREALKGVMLWITNWQPEFTYDPDWPEYKEKARQALEEAR